MPAVSSAVLYEIFPFIIVFGEDMVVQSIGRSLTQILPKLTGQKMNEFFDIVRPLVEFQFNSILSRWEGSSKEGLFDTACKVQQHL